MNTIKSQAIVKSCQVRCLCGYIQRVANVNPIHCLQCGTKLSIETPYHKTWLEYIPWAEMPDNVPEGRTPHGYQTIYPFAAVVGK
jgi:hypothetical protein